MPLLAWQIAKEIVDKTEQHKEPAKDPQGADDMKAIAARNAEILGLKQKGCK